MNDEKYLFLSDAAEKKNIGRSSKHRTNGGGRVVFPSDHLTPSERRKLNGKVKTYKLKEPMKWPAFKQMPVELQITYIRLIRKSWNPPDSELARMFGINRNTLGSLLKELDLASVSRSGTTPWDRKGWERWLDPDAPDVDGDLDMDHALAEIVHKMMEYSGKLELTGTLEEVMGFAQSILWGARVRITIELEDD